MFGFRRTTISPIGLDIAHDCVRMIQLHRVGEQLAVRAMATAPLGMPASAHPWELAARVAKTVREELRRRGSKFQGRHIVAAVPGHLLQTRSLRVPMAGGGDLAQMIRCEAANSLPFALVDGAIQYISAGQVRQEGQTLQQVLVLAARKSDISQFIAPFREAGLLIEDLDVEPCALYRTIGRFVRRRDDEHDLHVMVDIGWQRTLVVIGKGRDVRFIKSIDLGGRHLQDAVTRKLGVTPQEALGLRQRLTEGSDARDPVQHAVNDATRGLMDQLAGEVSNCVRYHAITFRGDRPGAVRLSGSEVGDPQWSIVLQRTIGIPVERSGVLGAIEGNTLLSSEFRSEWAVAFGLSLKCVEGSYGPRDGKPRQMFREGSHFPDGKPVTAGLVG